MGPDPPLLGRGVRSDPPTNLNTKGLPMGRFQKNSGKIFWCCAPELNKFFPRFFASNFCMFGCFSWT